MADKYNRNTEETTTEEPRDIDMSKSFSKRYPEMALLSMKMTKIQLLANAKNIIKGIVDDRDNAQIAFANQLKRSGDIATKSANATALNHKYEREIVGHKKTITRAKLVIRAYFIIIVLLVMYSGIMTMFALK